MTSTRLLCAEKEARTEQLTNWNIHSYIEKHGFTGASIKTTSGSDRAGEMA